MQIYLKSEAAKLRGICKSPIKWVLRTETWVLSKNNMLLTLEPSLQGPPGLFFDFLRQGLSIQFWMAQYSQDRPGWPWTCCDFPACFPGAGIIRMWHTMPG